MTDTKNAVFTADALGHIAGVEQISALCLVMLKNILDDVFTAGLQVGCVLLIAHVLVHLKLPDIPKTEVAGRSQCIPNSSDFFSQDHAGELHGVQVQGLFAFDGSIALSGAVSRNNLPASTAKDTLRFLMERDPGSPIGKTFAPLISAVDIEIDFLVHV